MVQPGGAGRDARAKLLHRPAEPLDVHQEDAQQREASDRIQRKDAPRRVDRRERRGVSAHRVASPCDVVGRQCSWPPSPWTWPCSTSSGLASRTSTTSMSKCRSLRSEEHTSELQSIMRISYAVFCLKKKTRQKNK